MILRHNNTKAVLSTLYKSLALVSLLALLALIIATGPLITWNSTRTFLAIAAFEGLSTYTGSGGDIFGQYYPPLGWFLYSIARVFNEPTKLILATTALNVFWYCLAILIVLSSVKQLRFTTTALTLSLWLLIPTTFYMLSHAHIDAPAIGLSLVSTWLLTQTRPARNQKIIWSAVLLSLAVWNKQSMIFLLPAHIVIIFFSHSLRRLSTYLAAFIILTLAIGGAFSSQYGFSNLVFHIFELPGLTPSGQLLSQLTKIIDQALLPFIFLSVLIFLFSFTDFKSKIERPAKAILKWLTKSPSGAFFLASLFLVPISAAGRIRYGGDVNSLIFVPFMLMSLAFSIASWAEVSAMKMRVLMAMNLLLLFLVVIRVGIAYPSHELRQPITTAWKRVISHEVRRDNPTHEAYNYLLKKNDQAYFPSFPLAMWMATKKPAPHETSVCEREYILGFKPSREAILNQLSFSPSEIVYRRERLTDVCDKKLNYMLNNYFSDAIEKTFDDNEMNDWYRYTLE